VHHQSFYHRSLPLTFPVFVWSRARNFNMAGKRAV
jgi:hypothetical protein